MKKLTRQLLRISTVTIHLAVTLTSYPAVAAVTEQTWVLGGYLPSNPNQKIYLKIQGRKIAEKLTSKPAGDRVIDTEAFVFPGIVDLHNHMEDGFLGLWKSARGQYFNRFEWRATSEYKLTVKNNEAAFNGDNEATCAAFRWAEIKALAGGATSIQGSGAKGSCVSSFGINNVEINGEYGNKAEIRSNLELVNPGNVKRVFMPHIRPKMQAGLSYQEALKKTMDETGVTKWISTFKSKPRTLANGLALAFGDSMGASQEADSEKAAVEFKKLIPAIVTKAKTFKDEDGKPEFKFDPKTDTSSSLNSYITALSTFLFGDAKNKKYIDPNGEKNDDTALDFLGRGGNRTIGSMKRYLTMFEFGLKRGAINALKSGKASSFVTHLAEGMRHDSYNKEEFRIARDMELLVPGMVLIHAVGMRVDQESDFKFAAAKGLSLVWSPFSNLLLYGETLDIAEARAQDINLAMGTDWSPTGSKNMLDELKVARRYIDQQLAKKDLTESQRKFLLTFTDQNLSEMATINAYKAMGVQNLIGSIEPGFQADFTLIAKSAMNRTTKTNKTPYSAMVYGEQEDVSLVVVKGQPLYGDVAHIKTAAKIFADDKTVENLPQSNSCSFTKAIRYPFESPLDKSLSRERDFLSVSGLEDTLSRVLRNNKAVDDSHRATLDALFTCEETVQTQYGLRFKNFVEMEVIINFQQREQIRNQQNLDANFSILGDEDDAP